MNVVSSLSPLNGVDLLIKRLISGALHGRGALIRIAVVALCTSVTLRKCNLINTRLHQGPVFKLCKPSNKKGKRNMFYRGAISWNALAADNRIFFFRFLRHGLKAISIYNKK